MAFDFKKEYKEFYLPKNKPSLIEVPVMNFVAVRGKGDPNDENGEYKKAMNLLYGVSFTVKMSKKGDHRNDRYRLRSQGEVRVGVYDKASGFCHEN